MDLQITLIPGVSRLLLHAECFEGSERRDSNPPTAAPSPSPGDGPYRFSFTESLVVSALPASSASSTLSFAFAFLPFFSAFVIFLASLPFFGFSFRFFDSSESTLLVCA